MARRRRHAPLKDECAPASRSMHQTSLYHKDNFVLPQLRALDLIQSALQSDAKSQSLKYDTGEPSSGSARFCISMPRSPQHQKFCSPRAHSEAIPSIADSPPSPAEFNTQASHWSQMTPNLKSPKSPKAAVRSAKPECLKHLGFNKHTLHLLFREIDRKATGFVTYRGVIFALNKKLRDILPETIAVIEAISWLKEIAREVDIDDTGTMGWKQFLRFFRRAGLLLKYEEDEEDENVLKEFLQPIQAKNEELRKTLISDIGDEHLELQSEIRTMVGKAESERFNKNRRAGTPQQETDPQGGWPTTPPSRPDALKEIGTSKKSVVTDTQAI